MTKEKHFKRMVRETCKRTGESYAAARARLDKRRTERERTGGPSPFDGMRALKPLIELASQEVFEEIRREEAGGLKWIPYEQRPGSPSVVLSRGAAALRERLEALSDCDLFATLVIIIWGKITRVSEFAEAVADARGCVTQFGIDFAVDYAFRKLPATAEYFREGLALVESAGATPDACWEAAFDPTHGPPLESLSRRAAERSW